MNIKVNGEVLTVAQSETLDNVLQAQADQLNLDLQYCVVAVNQSLIHRQDYNAHELSQGDEVDILTAVVGG